QQFWIRRRSCSQSSVRSSAWNWQWLWIATVPAGFAVYLLINWSVSGDPFAFLQARKTLFDQSFALPLAGIRQAIWAQYPTPHELAAWSPLFFALFALLFARGEWAF